MSLLFEDDELELPELSVSLDLGLTLSAVPKVVRVIKPELRIAVMILPEVTTGRSQHTKWRFKADGAEIGIKAFTVDAPQTAAGQRLDLTLTDSTIREQIKNAASFSFEAALVNLLDGSFTWQPLFEDGRLLSTQLGIAYGQNQPQDSLSVSIVSPLASKLNKTSDTDLLIYDPARVPLGASEEPLQDTSGNVYAEELVAVSNLRIHDLFQKILVERCGFSGFETNLPNDPVRMARASMQQSLYAGAIAPHIGQFDPLTFEIGGVIWIMDGTLDGDGLPSPRDLTVSQFKQLSVSEQFQQIDGYIMNYSETDDGLNDYFDLRVETATDEPTGNIFDETYSITETKKTYKDFKPEAGSPIVTSSQLWKEEQTTTGTFGDVLASTVLTREFDAYGREKRTTKVVQNRVPDLPTGTDLVLKEVSREIYKVTYLPHPIEKGKQYIGKTVREITGLIAVDSENKYLDQDFEQDFINAHRAGNLTSGMTTRTGAIKKIIEKITPLSGGIVQTETITEDLVRKITSRQESESKVGDIAVSSSTSKQRRIIVLASDTAVRTGKPLLEISVGEMNFNEAVALVRRKIAKNNAGLSSSSVSIAGFDLTAMQKGARRTAKSRNGSDLGVLTIEGCRISGSALGTPDQKISTEVQS